MNATTPSDQLRASFVVSTRNDGFGGQMLERLGTAVDSLLALANRHRLAGELIIVEWNPPDGPRLYEDLKLNEKSDHFGVRFIEVPGEIHRSLRNSDSIPLFQMIAKNVGIRRARGELVIATNQDILFSDGLVKFLARGEFDRDAMYRVDRRDVPAELPVGSIDDLLSWCDRNVIRVHNRFRSVDQRKPGFRMPSLRDLRALPRVMRGASSRALEQAAGALKYMAEVIAAGGVAVHTNGCGDFTALSRDWWHRLRGYPELQLFSMHLDSLLCWQATAGGAQQIILGGDRKIYHVEHAHSWAVMNWREKLATFAEKPWLDLHLAGDIRREVRRASEAAVFNDANWGLGDETLNEVEILSGGPTPSVDEHPSQVRRPDTQGEEWE